jgi:hypothetical protein
MARQPNYDFEKRRKEQERKAKKDAKRAEREARRQKPEDGTEPTDASIPNDETAG